MVNERRRRPTPKTPSAGRGRHVGNAPHMTWKWPSAMILGAGRQTFLTQDACWDRRADSGHSMTNRSHINTAFSRPAKYRANPRTRSCNSGGASHHPQYTQPPASYPTNGSTSRPNSSNALSTDIRERGDVTFGSSRRTVASIGSRGSKKADTKMMRHCSPCQVDQSGRSASLHPRVQLAEHFPHGHVEPRQHVAAREAVVLRQQDRVLGVGEYAHGA